MKSTLKITIECNGNKFSINCTKSLFGKWRVKNGRTLSRKKPTATITEIFDMARRWVVLNSKLQ